MWQMVVTALALTVTALAGRPAVTLELRVFNGAAEVTAETRITVHRSGERSDPVTQTGARDGRIEVTLRPGIYDVQALREQDGRVINIRWAERLVVMEYPDEAGRHLEVINFTNGYGALQVRQRGTPAQPDAALYLAGNHEQPASTAIPGPDYLLFVVPAATYDVQVRSGGRESWHRGIEVPLERTRLWFMP
jgi:hypothetical protein